MASQPEKPDKRVKGFGQTLKVPGKGQGLKQQISKDTAAKKKFEAISQPPVMVNPDRAAADLESQSEVGYGRPYRHPVGLYHMGRFLKSDSEMDQRLAARREFIEKNGTPGNPGMTSYGMVMADPSEIEQYMTDKKNAQDWFRTIRLAEYLIDPKDPRTQRDAYRIVPELERIPQDEYTQRIALNMMIHELVRQGEVRSMEDLQLIQWVCRDDFNFDVFPAWDPEGAITHSIEPWSKIIDDGFKRSVFNPRQWASLRTQDDNIATSNGRAAAQKAIKKRILRRCMPGLRDAPDNELEKIMSGWNEVTNTPLENRLFGYDWKRRDNRMQNDQLYRSQRANAGDAIKRATGSLGFTTEPQ